jgi:hypothetical protein
MWAAIALFGIGLGAGVAVFEILLSPLIRHNEERGII